MNVEIRTEAAQFQKKGIHKWDFHCSEVCGRDIHVVFITCIWRVCAPQVCNFKLLQCVGSLEAHVYLPAHVRRAVGTGVLYIHFYDPLLGFLPADPRWRICVLTCITITAPTMSSFPESSCHVTPSPVFYRLIQDGGFSCLPESQSQPRKCRLFPSPLVK